MPDNEKETKPARFDEFFNTAKEVAKINQEAKLLNDQGYFAYHWCSQAEDVSNPEDEEVVAVGFKDPINKKIAILMPRKAWVTAAKILLLKYDKEPEK